MAISATSYLQFVVGEVEGIGGHFQEEPAINVYTEADDLASLELRFVFTDGTRLSLFLFVDTAGDFPIWEKYRLHYMDAMGTCIFRYDNAPHHPGVRHFPHHKHVGRLEAVEETRPAHLRNILSEIKSYLERVAAETP